MRQARLVLHGLRVARPRQLAARAVRPVRRRRFPSAETQQPRPLSANEKLWRSEAFAPLGARPEPGSRLAAFHAHYGEDVLVAARCGEDAANLAAEWIRANPPRIGDAWHPYPLSTRVANWIAALTLDPSLAPRVAESLGRQLAHLVWNVEDDVLGNHVIRNAKALVLGGAALGDERLLRRGRVLLERELPEQVLPDGGHYERSPAYHRLVLRDLLEVQPFAEVNAEIERMRVFAAASSRPDGAPALFNDGGLDIAPRLELPPPPDGLAVFADTGYVFVRDGDLWLAFDCGAPSPRFLPAHAHADALSLQLWWKGRAVLVDPGTFTYEPGPERDWFRSTRAHSTVSIGGKDQFQLWGAFRAGPLPQGALDDARPGRLEGHVRWPTREIHRRTVEWSEHEVTIRDESPASFENRLVLAPELPPGVRIEPVAEAEDAWLSERFGERVPTRALVQRGGDWRIDLR